MKRMNDVFKTVFRIDFYYMARLSTPSPKFDAITPLLRTPYPPSRRPVDGRGNFKAHLLTRGPVRVITDYHSARFIHFWASEIKGLDSVATAICLEATNIYENLRLPG